MPVADTSFLVAYFDRADPRFSTTRQAFADADHVVIPSEVLVETLGVLKVKAGRATARAALEDLMRIENVGWEETSDLMAAYRIYRSKDTRSLVDGFVIHCCMRLRTPALTYDTLLARLVTEALA